MKTIAYVGMSDVQEFTKADFVKAGVEEADLPKSKLTFRQGEPTEVNDGLAELLLDESEDNVLGYAKFKDLTEKAEGAEGSAEVDAEAQKAVETETKKSSKKNAGGKATSGSNATASSVADDPGTADTGPSSTGSGSST